MTLKDALVAYKTYARAEGKSPKTVAWVASSVGSLTIFLIVQFDGLLPRATLRKPKIAYSPIPS